MCIWNNFHNIVKRTIKDNTTLIFTSVSVVTLVPAACPQCGKPAANPVECDIPGVLPNRRIAHGVCFSPAILHPLIMPG